MTLRKIDNIQALRAIAALSVVMFHAGGSSMQYSTTPSNIESATRCLAYGVDLFFVISGFVIFSTTAVDKISWAEFLRRRIVRIVPIYWLLTIVFFGILLLSPGLKTASITGWPKFFASMGFVSFAWWKYPVIYAGWSLEYEMLFYALTAVALLALKRRPWPFVAIVLCAATLSRSLTGGQASMAAAFLTDAIVLAFLGGILIGQWARFGRPGWIEVTAFGAGIAFAVYDNPSQRILFAGLPSIAIVCAAIALERGRMTAPAWLVKIGDASYAIYLVHVFVISMVGKFARMIATDISPEWLVTSMTVIPVLVGFGTHRWIELPLNKFFARNRPAAVALGF